MRYVGNIVSVGLNVILVVALSGYFGIETTTFAAFAGGCRANGAARFGLLANFAAGGFIVVLCPLKSAISLPLVA